MPGKKRKISNKNLNTVNLHLEGKMPMYNSYPFVFSLKLKSTGTQFSKKFSRCKTPCNYTAQNSEHFS
jgi:hypothetical protein